MQQGDTMRAARRNISGTALPRMARLLPRNILGICLFMPCKK